METSAAFVQFGPPERIKYEGTCTRAASGPIVAQRRARSNLGWRSLPVSRILTAIHFVGEFDEVTTPSKSNGAPLLTKQEIRNAAVQEIEIAKQVPRRALRKHSRLSSPRNTRESASRLSKSAGLLRLSESRQGAPRLPSAGIPEKNRRRLLMANLQANLRSQCAIALDQRNALCSVNQLFCGHTTGRRLRHPFLRRNTRRGNRLRMQLRAHLPALLNPQR